MITFTDVLQSHDAVVLVGCISEWETDVTCIRINVVSMDLMCHWQWWLTSNEAKDAHTRLLKITIVVLEHLYKYVLNHVLPMTTDKPCSKVEAVIYTYLNYAFTNANRSHYCMFTAGYHYICQWGTQDFIFTIWSSLLKIISAPLQNETI